MLTYSYTALWFFVPIYCWLLDKYHKISLNTRRTSSFEKSLSEKYVHIPGCQKNGGSFKQESRKIGSFIYFLLKNGGQSYTWQRWKRGPFGTHIRTMPYIESYPLPPPPPLPAPEHHYNSTNKHSILAISLNFALLLNRVPKTQNWVFFTVLLKLTSIS